MANYNTIGDCYDILKTLKTECPFSLYLLRLPLASVAPLAEKGVAGKGAAALVPGLNTAETGREALRIGIHQDPKCSLDALNYC